MPLDVLSKLANEKWFAPAAALAVVVLWNVVKWLWGQLDQHKKQAAAREAADKAKWQADVTAAFNDLYTRVKALETHLTSCCPADHVKAILENKEVIQKVINNLTNDRMKRGFERKLRDKETAELRERLDRIDRGSKP